MQKPVARYSLNLRKFFWESLISRGGSPRLTVWVCATFVGAGLLFLVQPMIAKILLPALGGSPAVWNTCMVFFQATLLAGYLYAHLLTRLESRRRQLIVHLVVLVSAMGILPIGLPADWKPPVEGAPIGWLFLALTLSVGPPFFVLSSAGPLLQSWFAGTGHRLAKDPYFLYAASNAGSMLALLVYPSVVEPLLSLTDQRKFWSMGYAVFAVLVVACGLMVLWSKASAVKSTEKEGPDPPPLKWRTRTHWMLLAFVPSSLMLGVTQHLSTDIAAFPLLWVIPLTVYLLTFIIVFSAWGRGPVRVATVFLPIVAVLLVMLLMMKLTAPIVPQIVIHLLGLLVIGLFCHGRLAAERPEAIRLTEFYLLMSIGGVLGGVFNSLLAPLIFNSIAEYPIVIVLACLLRWRPRKKAVQAAATWRSWLSHVDDVLLPILVLVAYLIAPKIVERLGLEGKVWGVSWKWLCQFVAPAVVCLLFAPRRLPFALGIVAMLFAPRLGFSANEQLVYVERTFFGVHRVIRMHDESRNWHILKHGTTLHGMQYDQEPLVSRPTTYYTVSGPVGDVMRVLASDERPRQIAIAGLGVGTIAAYGLPQWRMTFYEIDPEVARIAKDQRFFTYLSQSRSPIDIVAGDARLKIASVPNGHYDLILLDAFSSDALPIHLITREAMELYLEKLAPDGLLMFHITNRYLNLAPVLAGLASELNLMAAGQADGMVKKRQWRTGKMPSTWVVLARTPAALGSILSNKAWQIPKATSRRPVWTDNYSNVLAVFE